jgi:clan AA aspartic protease
MRCSNSCILQSSGSPCRNDVLFLNGVCTYPTSFRYKKLLEANSGLIREGYSFLPKSNDLVKVALKLTNLFNRKQVEVDALVDTEATFMCVTEEVALQLGFDITEVSQQVVTLTDGHQRKVPKIAPIEIVFENRSYVTEAVVLGNEPLMGVIPLEAMDLVVDPRQALVVNLQHPNYPVALGKVIKEKAELSRLGKKIVDRTSDAGKSADDFFIGGNQRNAKHLGQGDELAVVSRTGAGLNQLHYGNRGHIVFIAEHQAFGLPENQQRVFDR